MPRSAPDIMDDKTITSRLHAAGLRITKSRLALARLLFAEGDRHATAEGLHAEAHRAGLKVSLATVYNTLNRFRDAGLLRAVVVEHARTHFDTNLAHHHHFFIEAENRLVDIPAPRLGVARLPRAPQGYDIAGVDVVVRLNAK